MYDLIIRDATILNSGGRRVADIAVEAGKIAYIGDSPGASAREEVPGIGRFVMPGVIDTQVRMRQSGAARKPSWARSSEAAVRSGITTVFDLPDAHAPGGSAAELSAKAEQAAAESLCNFGFWADGDAADPAALAALLAEGLAVAALTNLDAGGAIDRLPGLFDASAGRTLGVASSTLEQLEALIAAVTTSGAPTHLMGLSTAAELNRLDPIRGDIPLSSGVQPAHLFLSIETLKPDLQGLVHVHPPVRSERDRRAIWAAMKRGRVDLACSAHSPVDRSSRTGADPVLGLPAISLLFPLLMSAVKHGRIGLERVVEMCCEAPARIFGLPDKGRIEVGADADLLLVTEGETERLHDQLAWAASDWSPFLNRDAGTPPALVLIGGRVVARGGQLEAGVGRGGPVRSVVPSA